MIDEQVATLLATRRAPGRPHLEVLGGPEDGRICTLHVGVTRIGRDAGNQLDLTLDGSVSPNHARIEWRGGSYYLADSDSSGGTWLDGKRIDGAVLLRPGQTFVVGSTKLRFDDGREREGTRE